MKKIYLNLFLILFGQCVFAQEVKTYLYKGTIDKMPVTLYLIENISGCPSTTYEGMYKYDKISNWLQLEISDDEDKKLVMVENRITGILSLKKQNNSLNGYWISPDGNKKLNVQLKEVPLTNKIKEELEDKFEKVNYENHDC